MHCHFNYNIFIFIRSFMDIFMDISVITLTSNSIEYAVQTIFIIQFRYLLIVKEGKAARMLFRK